MVFFTDFVSIGNLLEIAISILSIGAILFQIFRWFNKKQDEKASKLKTETEKIAADLKKQVTDNAHELIRELEDKNRTLRESILEKLEGQNTHALLFETEFKDLIKDLTTRQSLVNGNVSNIRKDLMELQDSVDTISDPNNNNKKRQRLRKRKSDEIEHDRLGQNNSDSYHPESERKS